MTAKYRKGCRQRDSVEREAYAGAPSASNREGKERGGAEELLENAVEADLSKYFDTLNHELLMNLLRKQICDKRVTEMIKKYLKSGVMKNVPIGTRGGVGGRPLSGPPARLFSYLLALYGRI